MMAARLDGPAHAPSTTILTSAWPHLSAVAHRLADAPDGGTERLIHHAWRRWASAERAVPTGVLAQLAAAAHRIAVVVVASARRRPARVVADRHGRPIEPGTGPGSAAERTQAAELVVLLLHDQLSPAEQVAYVLRKAFDCPGAVLRSVLRSGLAGTPVPIRAVRPHRVRPAAVRRVVRAYRAAARSGNLADIEDLLGADLVDRPGLWRRLSHPAGPSGPTG